MIPGPVSSSASVPFRATISVGRKEIPLVSRPEPESSTAADDVRPYDKSESSKLLRATDGNPSVLLFVTLTIEGTHRFFGKLSDEENPLDGCTRVRCRAAFGAAGVMHRDVGWSSRFAAGAMPQARSVGRVCMNE